MNKKHKVTFEFEDYQTAIDFLAFHSDGGGEEAFDAGLEGIARLYRDEHVPAKFIYDYKKLKVKVLRKRTNDEEV